jgi:hypothetical protein
MLRVRRAVVFLLVVVLAAGLRLREADRHLSVLQPVSRADAREWSGSACVRACVYARALVGGEADWEFCVAVSGCYAAPS